MSAEEEVSVPLRGLVFRTYYDLEQQYNYLHSFPSPYGA